MSSVSPPPQIPSEFVRVNVAGREFLIKKENLDLFPKTLLGSDDREKYWRDDLQAYYFDRNREFFTAVQQFYRTKGEFHYPTQSINDPTILMKELEFYRIQCDEPDGFSLEAVSLKSPSFKQKMYMLLNFADSSPSANVLAWADCLLIGLSIVMLIIESEPRFKRYFSSTEEEAHAYAMAANSIIMGYFTMDYLLRVLSHPTYCGFFQLYLPWFDLLSIMPFYLELVMVVMIKSGDVDDEEHMDSHDGNNKVYTVLRICRIFRVTRVFKLVRRCESLLVLVKALAKTKKELLLLAAMVSLSTVLMGAIMYFVETQLHDRNHNDFNSIMSACWWAIITITTVGYGDMVPDTFLGKIVGSVAVFMAIVLIALPATIIVTKFSEEYEKGVSNAKRRYQN